MGTLRRAFSPYAESAQVNADINAKTCAVVIPSHNRCDDLRLTCQEIDKFTPAPNEIIICLDGCSDGSKEMLTREFPNYRVLENAVQEGSIPSRDRAFRIVKSDLILTLDDDSYPTDPAFMEKVRAIVEQHPEAGAITFPEVRNDGRAANPRRTETSRGHYVRDFSDCAGVIARHLYGRAAEYPLFLKHAYGEPDFCLQLYAAGYAVWFEPSLTIRHRFTPKERNMMTRHRLNARNELWSVIMRCPFPDIVFLLPFRVLRQFVFAVSQGFSWWIREPLWWWRAIIGIPACLRHRKPVRWRAYREWLILARSPAFNLKDLQNRFDQPFNHTSNSEHFSRPTANLLATHRVLRNVLRLARSPRMAGHYLRWLWFTVFRAHSPTVLLHGGIRVGGFISFSDYWQHHRGLHPYDFHMIEMAVRACENGVIGVDVGANLGLFSMTLAQAGCELVHAFEPIPQTYARFQANLKRNPDLGHKIVANQLALGARAGTFDFTVSSTSPGQNKRVLPARESRLETRVACEVITLDHYFTAASHTEALVIKLDVEGFETDVLNGAECLLRRGQIRFIYSEIIPQALIEAGSSVTELAELLNSAGFEPVLVNREAMVAVSLAEAIDRAGASRNVLFRWHSVHAVRSV
jgi:FkbM family methyltransferase